MTFKSYGDRSSLSENSQDDYKQSGPLESPSQTPLVPWLCSLRVFEYIRALDGLDQMRLRRNDRSVVTTR